MSLNAIRLTGNLLEALYGKTLVLPEGGESLSVPTKPDIQFLGKNNRHIVVLVNYPDQLHLPDESFNFLGSVLKACQLNAADIAIVNLGRQSVTFDQLVNQLAPALLLDFGSGQQLPEIPAVENFQPTKHHNFQYMTAPSLENLNQAGEATKLLKKQLWDGLKYMLQL